MAHHVISAANGTIGGLLNGGLNKMLEGMEDFVRAHGVMDSARGAPADYSKIEGGTFGIATGEGADVFALVNSIKTTLDTFKASAGAWISDIDQGDIS